MVRQSPGEGRSPRSDRPACRKQAVEIGERASRFMAIGGRNVRGEPGPFVRGLRGNRAPQIGVAVSGALLFNDSVFHVAAGDPPGNAVVLVAAEPDMKFELQRLSSYLGEESAGREPNGPAQRLSVDVPAGNRVKLAWHGFWKSTCCKTSEVKRESNPKSHKIICHSFVDRHRGPTRMKATA